MSHEVADHWLIAATTGSPDIAGVAVAALMGDDAARGAVWDYASEQWGADVNPFDVGKTYLIQTVTLYYVGRVSRIVGAFVELEGASWVHWTGRLSTLCRMLKFTDFPGGHRKPRTEYIGRPTGINMGSVVSYVAGDFVLPAESLT